MTITMRLPVRQIRIFWLLLIGFTSFAMAPAVSVELKMPGYVIERKMEIEESGTYLIPMGPYSDGKVPSIETTGRIFAQSWQFRSTSLTTQQLISPLRKQIADQGFAVFFDCTDIGCGGFDFRFGTRVISAPDMFVDLFDYRFISAKRGEGAKSEFLSILASRTGTSGYVQIVYVTPGKAEKINVAGTSVDIGSDGRENDNVAAEKNTLAERLFEAGYVILSNLEFEPGSAKLGNGQNGLLDELAEFLKADSSRRVVLVGHTDSVGGLEDNLALSRRRAAAVRQRIVEDYDVSPEQVESDGVGYLSPIASNKSHEGRELNRRVEAVLLDSR
ncbi:MAG: OmpA family protein [Roseovarius sp.]|nr:OmpA family protein [Roseovarius sp.]